MPTPQTNDWREEFDKEFDFWKDITITPAQAGDFEKARLLQEYYRGTGERLKSFLSSLLSQKAEELNKELEWGKIWIARCICGIGMSNGRNNGCRGQCVKLNNSALSTAQELVNKIIK